MSFKIKKKKKKIVSLRSVTALGVVVAQIVAWTFPIPEYEEHSETGVGTRTITWRTKKML